MLTLYNTLVLTFGTLTLIFGIWTFFGLAIKPPSQKVRETRRKKIILGVCADFSATVGIPLWIVRLYAVVYAPLLLGLVFYLLYYWVMKRRKPPAPKQKRPVNVTRMEIHRY